MRISGRMASFIHGVDARDILESAVLTIHTSPSTETDLFNISSSNSILL